MSSSKKNTSNKKMTKKNNKGSSNKVEMYCVRCRKKVMATDIKKETLKNGRCMMKGKCPHCKGVCPKFVKC